MTKEETALLNAIAREPGEDLHRLGFADWLTENGDPNRAELLRLQCGLERGVDWQRGGEAKGWRLKQLRDREKELIKGLHSPKQGEPGIREFATTPGIAKILAHSQVCFFKRGMINNLILSHADITALPSDLYIGGNLALDNSNITVLPPGLHVGGNLCLIRASLTALSPGLHVGGNLRLNGTRITALPPDLHVDGNIEAHYTHITELPPGLHVGGDLHLTGTHITELPPGLHVVGNLHLTNTHIKELPPDLHVGGNLELSSTSITADAARRILNMPKLSRQAKVTGLESAYRFPALAEQARRLPETNAGPGTPPRP